MSLILFLSQACLSQTNFWQHTNGPYDSGFILSFAKDSSGRILAGTATQGIYSSSDGGQSWSSLGLVGSDVNCLAVTSDGVLFAGTGDLYRSTDGGSTWIKLRFPSFRVQSLCVTGNDRLVVGTGDYGVYTSDDSGKTWINRTEQLGRCNAIALYNLKDGAVFGSFLAPSCCSPLISPGIYRSIDSGSTWQKTTNLQPTSFSPDGAGGILAYVTGALYVSTDNGVQWVLRSSSIIGTASSSVISDNGILFAGTTQENGVGSGRVYKSTDQGATWAVTTSFLTSGDVRAMIVANQNSILAGNYYAGVFRSTDDGNTWAQSNSGIHNADITAVLAADANTVFCSRFSLYGATAIHRSTDGGQTWMTMDVGWNNPNARCFIRSSIGDVYAGGTFLFKSTDGGNSWQRTIVGSTNGLIYSLAEGVGGEIFAGTYANGVFRSTDRGSSWMAVNNGLSTLYISSMAFSSGALLAGGFSGQIFRSPNGGGTWEQFSLGTSLAVLCLHRLMNGILLAGTYGDGIYRSTDNGESWTALGGILGRQGIISIAENSEGELFVATSFDGVYTSTDGGSSWLQVNSGLTNLRTQCMSLSSSGFLYAGTWRGGLFRTEKSVNVHEGWTSTPSSFVLAPNYPNPFNPSTTITFDIPSSSDVTLLVFDLLGREVRTLVDEKMDPGRYSRTFEGAGLASGVYLYQLHAGSFVQTRKLVLLR